MVAITVFKAFFIKYGESATMAVAMIEKVSKRYVKGFTVDAEKKHPAQFTLGLNIWHNFWYKRSLS